MGKSRNIARLIVDATGAVDATNLGNAVPADGSITEAKLASDSVTAAKIATGAVGADELAATAVTAGTYGTASAIPAITVDADGRITGVTTNAVSGGVTSLNGQTGAITNTDFGAIGSYFAGYASLSGTTSISPGTTVAGSSLDRANTGSHGAFNELIDSANTTGAGLSGTWRAMSFSGNGIAWAGSSSFRAGNLWVRIS